MATFGKLFLTFVAGFVLRPGADIAQVESLGNQTRMGIFGALQLLGVLLLVVSPVC